MIRTRGSTIRAGACLLLILGLLAAVFVLQRRYIQHHLPLIRAQLAVADRQASGLLEEIDAPPGATPRSQINRRTFFGTGRRSHGMWRGEECAFQWSGEWDAPGEPDAIMAWYRQHLLAAGWMVYNQRVPTVLEDLYWKDKWLLTIARTASFATDQPPHARVLMTLDWT